MPLFLALVPDAALRRPGTARHGCPTACPAAPSSGEEQCCHRPDAGAVGACFGARRRARARTGPEVLGDLGVGQQAQRRLAALALLHAQLDLVQRDDYILQPVAAHACAGAMIRVWLGLGGFMRPVGGQTATHELQLRPSSNIGRQSLRAQSTGPDSAGGVFCRGRFCEAALGRGRAPLASARADAGVYVPSASGSASSCSGNRRCSSATNSSASAAHFCSQVGTRGPPPPPPSAHSRSPNACGRRASQARRGATRAARPPPLHAV